MEISLEHKNKTLCSAAKPPNKEIEDLKMNKTHGSRKRDIEMFIKVEILRGNIKRAIELCEQYKISSKDFGHLVREVYSVG